MIRAALKNPHLVVVVALAVLVLGVVHYQKIPADLLPIFRTPAVQIVTLYPGMPPEVMERDIMSRLQRWTGQSVGIAKQEAKAMLGVCIVKDYFREDISLDTAMAQVTSYAMSDMFYLPPGTMYPMTMPFDPTSSVPLCLISISSDKEVRTDEARKRLAKDLYDVAYYELRNRLQSIQGVIAPAVYGGTLRRILIYVDRDKLRGYGLDLIDVQQAVLKHNVFIPAGNAKIGPLDYQIFTNAMPDAVEKMNDIPIAYVDGAPIRVRDVGEARDSSQIQTNIVTINGRRPAMYIPIYRQPGANSIEIVNRLKARLERILQRIRTMDPDRAEGLQLNIVMDQSVGVRESIAGLQLAGLLGAALAGIIVWLFLRHWRLTFVIILAIPLSILASIIGLYYTSNTINAMTIGGLALAVGILIDQAIVVLDNVVRHREMGKSPLDAAVDGTREVAVPLFVSILTFIVVFYPVVFLSGLARYLFTPLALAVTFAVLAAYLVAMFFTPVCSMYLLRGETAKTASSGKPGRIYSAVVDGYGWLLRGALRYKGLTLAASVVVFFITLPLLLFAGTELFPQVDSGQFTIYVRMPSGTNVDATLEKIRAIEKFIQEDEELRLGRADPAGKDPSSNLKILISNIGVLMDWPAAYTPNTGPGDAFMLVQLKRAPGFPGVHEYVEKLREKLNERFAGVEFAFDTGGMLTAALNMGEPSPIHLQVTGSNLQTHQEIAQIIRSEVAKVPGAVDVRVFQRLDYPIVKIDIDRYKLADQGTDSERLVKNLVSATNSSVNFLPAFWLDPRNGNHYFIGVQYRESDIESFDTFLDTPVGGDRNRPPSPMRNLVKLRHETGPNVVTHRNITRTTDIYASVARGYDVGSVVAAIERRLRNNDRLELAPTAGGASWFGAAWIEGLRTAIVGPQEYQINGSFAGQGYALEFQGEVRSMREAFWQFLGGLLLAGVLIFLVMIPVFRSFVTPIIVMVTIPLGFVGVALVLWLTGTHLNIQSFMGIIMMMGIVVEYSIVLLDFADMRGRAGMSPEEAVYEAALVRFRPILMTSLTTILALLPMGIGFAGSEADQPLALAIIGGVVAATLLPKFVIPCMYALMKRPETAAVSN